MKNFYILIVFIFGLVVGVLGFVFMQNFTLNSEMKKVEAEELVLQSVSKENKFDVDWAKKYAFTALRVV